MVEQGYNMSQYESADVLLRLRSVDSRYERQLHLLEHSIYFFQRVQLFKVIECIPALLGYSADAFSRVELKDQGQVWRRCKAITLNNLNGVKACCSLVGGC